MKIFAVIFLPILCWGAAMAYLMGPVIPQPAAGALVFTLMCLPFYGAACARAGWEDGRK